MTLPQLRLTLTAMMRSISTLIVVSAATGVILLAGGMPLHAQSKAPPSAGQPSGETGKSPGKPGAKLTEKDVPRAKPKTPLEAALQDGIPKNAVKRTRVRDNLYALLATSSDEKSAKRISRALRRVYLTSGSPTVDLLMQRGIKAIKAKKFARALQFLSSVTELAPDFAEGWNRRAFIFYKQNNLRQAAGDLRRVLALDPSHYRALDGLGTILRETGDEAGAYKVYRRLNDINPHWPKAAKALDELKRKVEGRGI